MADQWILLVDDLTEWQETLSRLLRAEGYQADVADSLSQAIQQLNARMYHLAIIDIRLQDWDETNVEGMTILDELDRRYGDTEAIAKIMISAYSTAEQMRQAFKRHKVHDFIVKQTFDKHEFLAVVREAFERTVRMNPTLDIVLEDGLTFENIVGGIARDGRRVRSSDPDFARLVAELEDLFRRLFYSRTRIVLKRVSSGHSRSGVVKVEPFSKDGRDETVIAKFGDHKEIDREYRNYEAFVKDKIGTRATAVRELRRTPLLGGIIYSFIDTGVEGVVDFTEFYHSHSSADIHTVLDELFKETCANWYADRGMVQYAALSELYRATLRCEHKHLLDALEDNFPTFLNQTALTFRDLPGVHLTNPVYATQGKTLSRSTFLCTTHGDLNSGNILIDADGHPWLIDFYRTGPGHILRDCVELETVVKFILLEEKDLAARWDLEQALVGMSRFKDADALSYTAPNEALAKAFAACRQLRQIARDLVRPNDDFSEYEIGLLYCSLNTQRFYSVPKVNRLHALFAAGLLCEKLKLSP
ncbi:MAG TPA: response regulator [Anaerolineae bacterium]|nr:response regulator [Anaerolineae bacterium]